mgnify:FL=1
MDPVSPTQPPVTNPAAQPPGTPAAPTVEDAAASGGSGNAVLIGPALVGCFVAAAVGVYGRLHEPTGVAVNIAGFSSPQTVKVWLATVAALLALLQAFSALVMYGKIRMRNTDWTGPVHRWSGRAAFVVSIPVALHCLYALGFGDYNTRVLVHSLLGCFFYGAFATKMLLLTRRNIPGWALPLVGGVVFTGLAGLFVTSSLWFFTTFGFTF